MPSRKSKPPAGPSGRSHLGRQQWIDAARGALIAAGVEHVKIERIASDLGVTTGSFYWHFKNREALLNALLQDWANNNTRGIVDAVQSASSADAQFDALIAVWVNEDGYSPAYDSAVRDWARSSKQAEAAVLKVDRRRIALLKDIFLGLGFDEDRAEVRARITYFHQVGYYAMNCRKDLLKLKRLRPLFVEALREGPGRNQTD